MVQETMRKSKNGVFQIGSRFPEISGSVICNVKEDKILELEIGSLAKRVLDYLKKHKEAYISDLSTHFNTPPTKIVLAVKKLEKEGLVK
jgi:hypothetical protein